MQTDIYIVNGRSESKSRTALSRRSRLRVVGYLARDEWHEEVGGGFFELHLTWALDDTLGVVNKPIHFALL